MTAPLYEKLKALSESEMYPFHMPGHKRRLYKGEPYSIDITEISGFDNLHMPSGLLAELQGKLSSFYNAKESFLLVGGSTCGIMAAIISACPFGGSIIAARNCHRSVYKAIELYNLQPVWIYPETEPYTGICGEITAESVRAAIAQNPSASLVVITSPTYEGVISDAAMIASVCHEHGIPLLCDMAHGAHLPLMKEYPHAFGADIAITSLHKTLPCLTQTACACIYSDRADRAAFAAALEAFETSSPSYVLMSSADRLASLLESDGDRLSGEYLRRLDDFRTSTSRLEKLRLFSPERWSIDKGKLVIDCSRASVSGAELFALLRDTYGLECEMASARYVTAMTSICDDDEGFARLADALVRADGEVSCICPKPMPEMPHAVIKTTAYQASRNKEHILLPLNEAKGRTSGSYAFAYPPGIPIIAPGEEITEDAVRLIEYISESGTEIHTDCGGGLIRAI